MIKPEDVYGAQINKQAITKEEWTQKMLKLEDNCDISAGLFPKKNNEYQKLFEESSQEYKVYPQWVVVYKGKRLRINGKDSWRSANVVWGNITRIAAWHYWKEPDNAKLNAYKAWCRENIQVIPLIEWAHTVLLSK
jgi:hypothetical protein